MCVCVLLPLGFGLGRVCLGSFVGGWIGCSVGGFVGFVCFVGCSVGWSVDGLVLFDRFVGGLVGWLHGRLVS